MFILFHRCDVVITDPKAAQRTECTERQSTIPQQHRRTHVDLFVFFHLLYFVIDGHGQLWRCGRGHGYRFTQFIRFFV